MKRIIICSVLFLGAIVASCYSHIIVGKLSGELNLRIEVLTDVLHDNNEEEVREQITSLVDYWKEEEKILVHFVRHSHIDTISVSMSRLPALTEHSEYGEVYAELLSIQQQMEHIYEGEQLTSITSLL